MAHKRMFSKDITSSDAFREMPSSSQALYFHLGMEADDDGFLDNYRGLMRAVGGTEDDLKILLTKRFLILFPSKVIVVKHWKINNTVRTDRYKETRYLDEKKALIVKENGAYSENYVPGIPNGNQMATQYRIGEDRIVSGEESPRIVIQSEDEEEPPKKKDRRVKDKEAIFSLFGVKQPWWYHKQQREAALRLFDMRGLDKVSYGVEVMKENTDDPMCPQAHTPFEYESKLPKLSAYIKRKGL